MRKKANLHPAKTSDRCEYPLRPPAIEAESGSLPSSYRVYTRRSDIDQILRATCFLLDVKLPQWLEGVVEQYDGVALLGGAVGVSNVAV